MKIVLILAILTSIAGCASGVKLVRAPNEPVYPTNYAPLNQARHTIGTVSYNTDKLWKNKEHAYATMYDQCGGNYIIVRHDYSAHPGTIPMAGGQTTDSWNIGGPRYQTFFIDFQCYPPRRY